MKRKQMPSGRNDEPDYSVRCDRCKEPAVVNYQKVWERFVVANGYHEDGSFNCMDIEEPVGPDNIHLCKKHEAEWRGEEVE